MHMCSLYVSKSVLVVSFDLASSNRESVIQYAMGLKVLHVVQRVICIITLTHSARNNICTYGGDGGDIR